MQRLLTEARRRKAMDARYTFPVSDDSVCANALAPQTGNPEMMASRFVYPVQDGYNPISMSYELFFNSEDVIDISSRNRFIIPAFFARVLDNDVLSTEVLSDAIQDQTSDRKADTVRSIVIASESLWRKDKPGEDADQSRKLRHFVMKTLIIGCQRFDINVTGFSDMAVIKNSAKLLDASLDLNKQICHYLQQSRDNRIMMVSLGKLDDPLALSIEFQPFDLIQVSGSIVDAVWGSAARAKWDPDTKRQILESDHIRIWFVDNAREKTGKRIDAVPYSREIHNELTARVEASVVEAEIAKEKKERSPDPDRLMRLKDLLRLSMDDTAFQFADLWKMNQLPPPNIMRSIDVHSIIDINDFDISPDERFVALTSKWDGEHIHIADMNTGKILYRLSGHQGIVNMARYSDDGRFIVSGSSDTDVRIWDVESRTCKHKMQDPIENPLAPLTSHKHPVLSVAYSPDGKSVVSGATSVLKVWDTETGELKHALYHQSRFMVHSVDYSPDGAYIVSGSRDKTVKVWDVQTGQCKYTLSHNDSVVSVKYSPDNKHIASGSMDGTWKIWDAETGTLKLNQATKRVAPNQNTQLGKVGYSSDGRLLAISHAKGVVLYDTVQRKVKYIENEETFGRVQFYNNDHRLFVLKKPGAVGIWNVDTQRLVRSFFGPPLLSNIHVNYMKSFISTAGTTYIVTSGHDFKVHVWDVNTGKCKLVLDHSIGHICRDIPIAGSPVGDFIATAQCSTVRLWDAETGHLTKTFKDHTDDIIDIVFSPDGSRIATASRDRAVIVRNVYTDDMAKLKAKDEREQAIMVRFSPDGTHVVAYHHFKVLVWAVVEGVWTLTQTIPIGFILWLNYEMVYWQSQEYYIALLNRAKVSVYNKTTNEWVVRDKDINQDSFSSIQMSPDRTKIMTCHENSIKIWDAKDTEFDHAIATLRSLSNITSTACFLPDGKRVAVVQKDPASTALIWDWSKAAEHVTQPTPDFERLLWSDEARAVRRARDDDDEPGAGEKRGAAQPDTRNTRPRSVGALISLLRGQCIAE